MEANARSRMKKQFCKMLAPTILRMGSRAFRRMPPRQNVGLLFAFCSLNFYNSFVNSGRAASRGGHQRISPAFCRNPLRVRVSAGINLDAVRSAQTPRHRSPAGRRVSPCQSADVSAHSISNQRETSLPARLAQSYNSLAE